MRVRTATEADVDTVIDIGTTTWRATYPPLTGEEYVRAGIERWWTRAGTLAAIRDGRVLVAEDETGRSVGMASFGVSDGVVDLWKLYVLPDAQGLGAGSALVEEVAGRHTDQRVLRLAHKDGNDAAHAFYLRHGLTETGRSPDELGGPDNVWMERPLASVP